MTAAGEWWRALYDDLLAEVLLVRSDPDDATRTVAFLESALELRPGARVFDQCCGIGSLSLPLARRGYRVHGVDLGQGYAARGQAEAEAEGLPVDLRAGDAFSFVPEPACDAAFNWWTSFGYAPDDDRNLQMLRRALEGLRPGGRFALDFMNVPGVLAAFRPRMTTVRDTPLGRVTLVRDTRFDPATGVMHKVWRYRTPEGREVVHESAVRAYTPPELARLFSQAGFQDVRMVGDLDGGALTLESPRCLVLARRPT